MERTHISVGWYYAFPYRRYYHFFTKPGPWVDLKAHAERLMLELESIEGVKVADVWTDRDTISILRDENAVGREWADIEKDLAAVFTNRLQIIPHFVYEIRGS